MGTLITFYSFLNEKRNRQIYIYKAWKHAYICEERVIQLHKVVIALNAKYFDTYLVESICK